MWFSRVQDMLLESGPHLIVRAGEEWGLNYVLDSMKNSGFTVVFLDLDRGDAGNTIRLGNRLSDGVFHAVGSRLFGLGVPVHYGLNILRQNRPYLTPAVVVIRHPEYGPKLHEGLVQMASSEFKVLEVMDETTSVRNSEEITVLTSSDLRVRPDEAEDMFSDHLASNEVASLLHDSGGAYSTFLQLANRRLSLPPPARPLLGVTESFETSAHQGPALIDFLIRERRWIEAFELAVSTSRLDKAVSIIHHAGESYFEAGLFTQFWSQLRGLPEDVFLEDIPAYWLLSAAIAVDKQEEVKDFLWKQLGTRAMPNVRALMACSNTTSASLREAEIAFSQEKSVMTVRAMSHCLSSFGRPNEALRIALDNLPEVERLATPRELANYSYTISRILLFLGRYSAAHEWASWGLRVYEDARLKEELLRLALVSAQSFYALLLGKPDFARTLIASVSLDLGLAGIPSMDALFSTAADIAMVSGEYERALELYSVNYQESAREQIGYYLADLVGAKIMTGSIDEAVTMANDGFTLAEGTHERNVALTKLALGIANSFAGAKEARDQLQACVKYFLNSNDSVSLSRATLHLAQYYWRDGARDESGGPLPRGERAGPDRGRDAHPRPRRARRRRW